MGPFGDRRRWRSKEPQRERDRGGRNPAMFALLRALVLLMFGILVIQLINLQVIKGDEYKERAQINALREVSVPAARGLVLDRNGQPLVQNSARFAAAIVPGDLPERGDVGIYRQLSAIIKMPVEEIQAKVQDGIKRQGAYSPAVIKGDLDRDTALVLLELEPHAPGLKVLVEPSRRYLTGSLLSHVLGYVGPISAEEYAGLQASGYLYQDFIGKSGVESSYEDELRGKPGKKLIEVDAAGRELRVISERPPVDGANLVLSIDAGLQQKVAEILQEYARNSENAAAAVMDVKTGEVLAMVSLPTFDNNIFSGPLSDADLAALIDSPGKPLVNHSIAERYPPGSTFKTIVGSAALQEGVASAATTITSRGYITVENEFDPNVVYVYPDWSALGAMDFYRGLAMSSNVYFYYLAGGKADEGFRGLGEERVALYARAFGLGSPTGIDLPGESAGLVPDAAWKEETVGEPWTLGDTYNFGIGQGYVATTPLQMLTAVSAIANGGTLVTPHVAREFRDSHGNVLEAVQKPPRGQVPVDPQYLQVVRDGMLQSVTSGVAKNAAVSGIDVAGKTGTAEFGPDLGNGKHATHGWFVGFAPYEDPEIAVVVFVQRGGGGNDAAPAAARILDYYYHGPRLAAKPGGAP
ncbi:MAG: penicillin-binding protein 2 [Dehalococcoidia bacterium]|nr:penicillin-binding protein 2 [Dehalococcoidia bacterium]